MLQTDFHPGRQRGERASADTGQSLTEAIDAIVTVGRRQWPLVLSVIGCSVVFGLVYLALMPSVYTATAHLVIDTRRVPVFEQPSASDDTPIDAGMVQTQVEILKSEAVGQSVVGTLHLADDPEFGASTSGLFGAMWGANAEESASQRQHRALTIFDKARTITRVGPTYVMEIGFRSTDPGKAATIANAIAQAYISDQLDAKYQATRRAALWLQDHIADLRNQANAAERAVVDFKQTNNITTVDPAGRLMNEQQMSEVDNQLILAHAATAEAKARVDRIDDILQQDVPDASVADALKSEVIIRLRQHYLDLAGREAIWAAKYGPNHQAAIGLRTQMAELQRNIGDEMRKIAESYKSDYAIAQAREASIRASLDASISESHAAGRAQIELRELESASQSYRALYDAVLKRSLEAVQQQSFPITEARLITPASRPIARSQPRAAMVLVVTTLSGLLLGFGAAFLRDMADRAFRSSHQVEDKLQLNCLAMLPAVTPKTIGPATASPASAKPRSIGAEPGVLRQVMMEPFSRFAEGLRSVKIAVDLGNMAKDNRVIGFTSSLPNEGKSTASVNFAHLLAHAGHNVLLIDADLRNPSVSRAIAHAPKAGLLDVIAGRTRLEDVVWTDPVSQLAFLPVGGDTPLHHTSEILGSGPATHFIDTIRSQFDYVIVDLPPLAPVVDTRTTTGFVDSYVYVIEWGRTTFDVVEHALGDAREVYDKILGVVMNKTDLAVLGRYERHRSQAYYRKYYRRYGFTS